MLRSTITAGLFLLLTAIPVHAAGGKTTAQFAVCRAACTKVTNAQPALRDAMDDGIAHIAVRAMVPADATTRLDERDLMSLYLLLSLQRGTRMASP